MSLKGINMSRIKKCTYNKREFSKYEMERTWGLFRKNGWKVIMLFDTKEQAENYLETSYRYTKALYEIRKLDWGNDNGK